MTKETINKQQLPSPLDAYPATVEMERAVVLAILVQGDAIADVAERLLPDMFTHPGYRLVYRAMTALYDREADIDMLSIENDQLVESVGQLRTRIQGFLELRGL